MKLYAVILRIVVRALDWCVTELDRAEAKLQKRRSS